MKTLCIHHEGCADGFAAVVQHHIHSEIELLPAQYGDEAPDVTGKTVYIVDFSYPRDTLLRMNEQAKSLIVIDHHQTAQAACEGLDFCIFDMTKCGAVLTWEHLKMTKTEAFKQWCAERMGHPFGITMGREAVAELENEILLLRADLAKVDLESAYGDGFYNGFLKAQEINEKSGELLENYQTEHILSLSEDAESESKYPASELINNSI